MVERRKSKRNKTDNRTEQPDRAPDSSEQKAIENATERLKKRGRRVTIQLDKTKSGGEQVLPSHSDQIGWGRQLLDAFGTSEMPFAIDEMMRLIAVTRRDDGSLNDRTLNALLCTIDGCKPRNELEAMLASQAAVSHGLAMECLKRAKKAEMLPQFEAGGNMAVRLMRAFAGHVELLNKLQRGGEQHVRVEHVHVHSGGQAIVGNVSPGGRANEKFNHQPHAPEEARSIEASSVTPMRCEDAEREAVPVPGCEREEALPNARRRKR